MKKFSTLFVLGMFVLGFGVLQAPVSTAAPTQQKVVQKVLPFPGWGWYSF